MQLEELGVTATLPEELVVGTHRLDLPVDEDQDAVGHAHAGEAVRDEDGGLAGAQLLEALEDLELGARENPALRRKVEGLYVLVSLAVYLYLLVRLA